MHYICNKARAAHFPYMYTSQSLYSLPWHGTAIKIHFAKCLHILWQFHVSDEPFHHLIYCPVIYCGKEGRDKTLLQHSYILIHQIPAWLQNSAITYAAVQTKQSATSGDIQCLLMAMGWHGLMDQFWSIMPEHCQETAMQGKSVTGTIKRKKGRQRKGREKT